MALPGGLETDPGASLSLAAHAAALLMGLVASPLWPSSVIAVCTLEGAGVRDVLVNCFASHVERESYRSPLEEKCQIDALYGVLNTVWARPWCAYTIPWQITLSGPIVIYMRAAYITRETRLPGTRSRFLPCAVPPTLGKESPNPLFKLTALGVFNGLALGLRELNHAL